MNAFRFRPAVEPLGYYCQALTGRRPEPSGLGSGSPRVLASGVLRIARCPNFETHPAGRWRLTRFPMPCYLLQ